MALGTARAGAPLPAGLISHRKRMQMSNYYVYTYIDPRNLEEFYYGKGKGSRKSAHIFDVADLRRRNEFRL